MIWDIDREIVSFGPIALRWYSLLFALGIVVGYFIIQEFFKKENKPLRLLDSLLFYIVIGTVVGARLGHVLLYEPQDYLTNPLRILKIWEGGLASHGGFAGVMIALILYCRKYKEVSFFWLADRITIPAMLTAGFIRIGNFFNSEIIGHASDVPWAVIFKKVDMVPRHPTQIYEAIGYFIVAAIQYAAYRLSDRKPKEGRLFGLVLVTGYGFRLFIERYKENQVAFEDNMALNMGQLLSIPFILLGLFFALGFHEKIPFFQKGMSPEARGIDPTHDLLAGGDALTVEAKSRRGELRKKQKKLKK